MSIRGTKLVLLKNKWILSKRYCISRIPVLQNLLEAKFYRTVSDPPKIRTLRIAFKNRTA
jgi:hypothetical protein